MPKTSQSWLDLFLEFISYLRIDSKETGISPLVLYGGQRRFLEEMCAGLDNGIRHFVNLKARQLGISTISLAIDLFWLYVHPGLQGGLVTDTEGNRDKFRVILERYIESLPRSMRVGVKKSNRTTLVLQNGSTLDWVVAGSKKNGGLGRSRAWNFLHATEVSSYGDPEGMDSLIAALAQEHPDRLYVFESTARGYNLFHDMWAQAQADSLTQKAFFIGWWSKESYRFAENSRQWREWWGEQPHMTDEEKERWWAVKNKYGVRINSEQLAWYRWMQTMKIRSDQMMMQEYPWTEDEAFVSTGRSFFSLQRIDEEIRHLEADGMPFKGYTYHLGDKFNATKVEQVQSADQSDLKVWEEPHPNGIYVIGCDPAFGRSDNKDRHVIEVGRAYADRLVQVAEYATYDPEAYQVTWVLAHLAGTYRNCLINLEVTGPGMAIMQELKHLRELLDAGMMKIDAEDEINRELFSSIRWYLYHRPDSMGAGYCYGWKTTLDNKILILNQFRDSVALRQFQPRSMKLLGEMRTLVQEGSHIAAAGTKKDDRVFASALMHKAWVDWCRTELIANGQSYAKVTEAELQANDEAAREHTFHQFLVQDFFKRKELEKVVNQDRRMRPLTLQEIGSDQPGGGIINQGWR